MRANLPLSTEYYTAHAQVWRFSRSHAHQGVGSFFQWPTVWQPWLLVPIVAGCGISTKPLRPQRQFVEHLSPQIRQGLLNRGGKAGAGLAGVLQALGVLHAFAGDHRRGVELALAAALVAKQAAVAQVAIIEGGAVHVVCAGTRGGRVSISARRDAEALALPADNAWTSPEVSPAVVGAGLPSNCHIQRQFLGLRASDISINTPRKRNTMTRIFSCTAREK